MEPVRPPLGPVAPQAVARVAPLGRGWMLVAVEAGFALRNAAEGVDLRLKPDEAEGLRRGTVTPEALLAQAGGAPQPPVAGLVAGQMASQMASQMTVRFSPEALRLSGQTGAKAGRQGKSAPQRPVQPIRARMVLIGAGCLALLVLVLIGA